MKEMFCFQCQQTAHNIACEGKSGVCGKKADTSNFQDELIGALIGLARGQSRAILQRIPIGLCWKAFSQQLRMLILTMLPLRR